MVLFSIFSMFLALVFVLPLMLQPLSLGAMIMLAALFCALMMGLDSSSWFGYVLFLMYVGGMLVMFAYVAALTPNMMFSSMNALKLVFLVVGIFMFMILSTYVHFSKGVSAGFSSVVEFAELNSGVLVVSYNVSIFISLSIILFLALVAVVKICYFQDGPLRSFK